MSRKTMDEFDSLYNIWKPPRTTHPQNDDTRAQQLIDGKPAEVSSRAYKTPWNTHLKDATASFTDALWGINESKRDLAPEEDD